MGHNRAGVARKKRFQRRRKEVQRLREKYAAANVVAQEQGLPTTDYTRVLRQAARFAK